MNENEVLCGCFNVTVGDVRKAIDHGARTFEEVQEATKLGTGCQGCIEDAKKIVADMLSIKR